MKVFFTSILALGCIVVLLLGHQHWVEKTKVEGAQITYEETTSPVTTPIKSNSERLKDGRKPIKDLLKLVGNWPEKSKSVFQADYTKGKPFTILISGSKALGKGFTSWPEIVKQNLLNQFGKKVINVKIAEYELTSKEFVDEKKQDELTGDMIIFEPLTLNDNGVLLSRDSLLNIQTIIKDVQSQNDKTQFVLTPPHPIFNGKYYPVQVSELKAFANEKHIPYLDHWTAWPDYKSEEIKNYLSEDMSEPSVKGHEVWAKYVTDYLIKE